eukprot:TRINITY_DN3398_c0_g1_i3.p1 TRINITY_DN3398_c0_g1~~TRINITY_DN3398_c0_g1_i3.p1  ORF type:complete len:137 (-),score=28.57 TRINITY_DN3398_c0_g1_i3:268-678(-)
MAPSTRLARPDVLNIHECVRISGLMNQQMKDKWGERASWRDLFQWLDDDLSGKVSNAEFNEFVREELAIDERVLPQESLLSLWRLLDADDGGFITHNEFNNFMRLGAHVVQGGEPWVNEDLVLRLEDLSKREQGSR